MNRKWVAECDFHQIHTKVEISKAMKKRVSHKSDIHVSSSRIIGYEWSYRRCVRSEKQVGSRV